MSFKHLILPGGRSLLNSFRYATTQEKSKYILFAIAIFVFWVSLFGLCSYVLEMFLRVELFGPYLVKKLLSILLLSLFWLLCFSNLVSAISSFYLSEDLHLIHGLPVSIRQIHSSRFFMTSINASWMMLIFGLPVFFAYGFIYHASMFYYFTLLLFLPCFLIIPTSIGVTISTILVNIFPAKRTKELMMAISLLFIIGLFVLLRVVQPEKLVNTDSFSDIMLFLNQLQTPSPRYLPTQWGTEILMPILTNEPGDSGYYLSLIISTSAMSYIICEWTSLLFYLRGWTFSQQSSSATKKRIHFLDDILVFSTKLFSSQTQSIIVKDIKTFFRDSGEWPQMLLILALIVVYLYSVKVLPLHGPFITAGIHNLIAFLNLAMVGFVVSSIAVRFLFTSVSVEGRAFWMLRASPFSARNFLYSKFILGFPILFVLGQVLVIFSNWLLHVNFLLTVIGVITMTGLSAGLAGLSIGIGAMYPNFKAENIAKIAAGPGGILFMVAAQIFVGIILAIEALPIYLIMRSILKNRPLLVWEVAVIISFLALAFLVNIFAVIIPLKRGARELEMRN